MSQKDINRLEWDVLILIAGGLALGYGLSVTELDSRIVAILPSGAVGMGLISTLVITTFILSTLISNSAVANLLLPIGLAAAYGQPGLLAVMLPISRHGASRQHTTQCDGLCSWRAHCQRHGEGRYSHRPVWHGNHSGGSNGLSVDPLVVKRVHTSLTLKLSLIQLRLNRPHV